MQFTAVAYADCFRTPASYDSCGKFEETDAFAAAVGPELEEDADELNSREEKGGLEESTDDNSSDLLWPSDDGN